MKTILCYGDWLTWGYDPSNGTRYAFAERWPGLLEAALCGRARVIGTSGQRRRIVRTKADR